MEHWGAARRNADNSHIARHQAMEHKEEEPSFHFKLISLHRSALNRQVREAVRIRRRGGAGQILNSKAEYSRCHIPRLVVEQEDEEVRKLRKKREKADKEDLQRIMEDMDLTWEQREDMEREQADKKRSRTMDMEEEVKVTQRKQKKMRFSKVEDNWGDEDREEGEGDTVEDSGIVEIVPKPMYSRGTLTTVITDYFTVVKTPETSVRMEVSNDEALLWEEKEDDKMWFEDYTSIWADITNPEGRLVKKPQSLEGVKYTSLNYEATMGDGYEDQESGTHRDEDQQQTAKKPHSVEGIKYTSLFYKATNKDQNLRDSQRDGNEDQESGIHRDEDQEHSIKKPEPVGGVKYTSLIYEEPMGDGKKDQESGIHRYEDQEHPVKKPHSVEGIKYTSLNYEATLRDEDQESGTHRYEDQELPVEKPHSVVGIKYTSLNYEATVKYLKEDDSREMEDDWGDMDEEDLLLISQYGDPGYGQEHPDLEKGRSTTPTIIHNEGGQEDNVTEVFPRVGDQHTTTQDRVRDEVVTGRGVDYHWSTAMFKHWNEINDEQKDKAFDLWTSPVTVKVPDIVKAVSLKQEEGTDRHTVKISSVSQDETMKQDDDLSTEEPSSGQCGTQNTSRAFSPFPPPTDTNTTPDVRSLGIQGVSFTPEHRGGEHCNNNTTTSQQHRGRGQSVSQYVTVGGSPALKTRCSYSTKGVCPTHGQGIEKFKGGHELVKTKDGKTKKRYIRRKYFVCDVDPVDNKKLKQSTLNFSKMMQDDRRGRGDADDSSRKGEGVLRFCNFCTSKVGQDQSCEHSTGSEEKGEVQRV